MNMPFQEYCRRVPECAERRKNFSPAAIAAAKWGKLARERGRARPAAGAPCHSERQVDRPSLPGALPPTPTSAPEPVVGARICFQVASGIFTGPSGAATSSIAAMTAPVAV